MRAQPHERTCIVTRVTTRRTGWSACARAGRGVATDIRSRLPGAASGCPPGRSCRRGGAQTGVFARPQGEGRGRGDPGGGRRRPARSRFLQMLALANKAGLVIAGFGKVATALEGRGARARRSDQQRRGRPAEDRAVRPSRRGGDRDRCENRHNIYVEPIGFGVGPHKCDTCCARGGRTSEAFLSRCVRLTLYRGGTTADSLAREGAESQAATSENADALENLMGMGRTDPRSDSE